jgi:electron transfer flavoprotein alpha subunit
VIAVIPVRAGQPATGADEVLAEAGGRALLVGSGAEAAASELGATGAARQLFFLEAGDFAPGRWARLLAACLEGQASVDPASASAAAAAVAEECILLPASPDGRDLAPRLAAVMQRPLLAGAIRVHGSTAWLARHNGRQLQQVSCPTPFVATLLPGVASSPVQAPASASASPSDAPAGARGAQPLHVAALSVESPAAGLGEDLERPHDPEIIEVLEPDPATVDLTEAPRIFAAGAGIGRADSIRRLQSVAATLGASVGATRVVTDAGLLGHERQIGTTGVAVSPRCYVAFGVSGAAQHLGGVGAPDHVISVNTDRSCPMMALADLAIVADADATLAELERLLAGSPLGGPADDPEGASIAGRVVARAGGGGDG